MDRRTDSEKNGSRNVGRKATKTTRWKERMKRWIKEGGGEVNTERMQLKKGAAKV